MRRAAFIGVLLLTGCEPMPPSGQPFQPVPVDDQAAGTVSEAEEAFDFDKDEADEDEDKSSSGSSASGGGLGFGLLPEESDEPSFQLIGSSTGSSGGITMIGAAESEPEAVAVAPIVPLAAPWQPGDALAGSWGVRLVSTTADAQPPLAQLGLADGSVVSVWPGKLVPEAGVVVLAIGRDMVQVAEIIPVGDHARVESRLLQAMRPEGVAVPE